MTNAEAASRPSLGVVIPAFNAEATIGGAIRSARAAGAMDIVVVDDGSVDETATYARRLGSRVIEQSNRGAAAARRNGVAAIDTDFVILLDADDELLQEGVQSSVRALEANPSAGFIVGTTIALGVDGGTRTILPWEEGVNLVSLLARGHSVGPPSAVVWRAPAIRDVFREPPIGLWPRYAEDYELVIRGVMASDAITHSIPVTQYRMDGGKSNKHPLASNVDAEAIRRHYAEMAGVEYRPRRERELRALAHLRKAYERPGSANMPRRISSYVAALSIDPGLFLGLLKRRSQRRMKARG